MTPESLGHVPPKQAPELTCYKSNKAQTMIPYRIAIATTLDDGPTERGQLDASKAKWQWKKVCPHTAQADAQPTAWINHKIID